MFEHVLVPTDGSPLATLALDKAVAFAAGVKARLTVLCVIEPFHRLSLDPDHLGEPRASFEAHAIRWADDILANAAGKAMAADVACDTLRVIADEPYRVIIATARERGADLIAMASHGRRGIDAVLIGSQTMKVLTHSTLPVLVYR